MKFNGIIPEDGTFFSTVSLEPTSTYDTLSDGERKAEDWWGYVWPCAYRMNKVVYTAGSPQISGGWFEDAWGDGVRIIGKPGGEAAFTSIAELEIYYE